jgi:hypothetical protein
MACTIAARPIQAMSSIFLPRILFYTIYGRAGPEGPARLSYQHVKEHPASGGTQKTPGRRSPARPSPTCVGMPFALYHSISIIQ